MASSVKRGLMGIGTLVAAGAVRMETMVLSQRSDVAWAAFGAVTLMGLGLGWVWGSKQRAAFLGIIAGAISLVGIITVVLWRGPWWFDGKYLAKADWVSGAGPLVTGFRTTVVQLLIAVGAGVALWYTHHNFQLARRGQITDRFVKALEHLGSDQRYVRYGGVIALEQIVTDAPEYAAATARILGVFIRESLPQRLAPRVETSLDDGEEEEPGPKVYPRLTAFGVQLVGIRRALAGLPPVVPPKKYVIDPEIYSLRKATPEDIQAALSLLVILSRDKEVIEGWEIDLRGVVLQGANLSNADLADALFDGADLKFTSFRNSNLANATFYSTDLRHTNLEEANLTGASLIRAHLGWASLENAKLMRTDLTYTKMNEATGLTAEQIVAAYPSHWTNLPVKISIDKDVQTRIEQVSGY